MKRSSCFLIMAAACLAVGITIAGTVESQNVVGFFKNEISGSRRRLMTVPMHKMPVATGQFDSNTSGGALTDNEASFGDYSPGSSGHENGTSTFYVEITSGTHEGRHWWITNNTATILYAGGFDLGANDVQNQTYKVIPAHRVRDIFGEPGGDVMLQAGSSYTSGTNGVVRFWDPDAGGGAGGWGNGLFYGAGFSGLQASKNGHWLTAMLGIADDTPIDRDEAMLVTRFRGEATNFVATGEVSANDQKIVIDAGYRVFAGGLSVVDVPIEESSITNAVGFSGGSSYDDPNALTIRKWDSEAGGGVGGWGDIIFQAKGLGGLQAVKNGRWVDATLNIVEGSYTLGAGEGYLITSPSNLVWNRESPLAE